VLTQPAGSALIERERHDQTVGGAKEREGGEAETSAVHWATAPRPFSPPRCSQDRAGDGEGLGKCRGTLCKGNLQGYSTDRGRKREGEKWSWPANIRFDHLFHFP
jgi:hypothetical protein